MAGLSKRLRGGVAAMAMMLAAGPAAAAVTYTFEATSSFGGAFGKFAYTAPTFITTGIVVPLANLDSCSVTSPATGFVCADQTFATVPGGIFDQIAFGARPIGGVVNFTNYNFAPGAFAAFGSYSTISFGTNQAGRLTVSRAGPGGPGPVPEPATWAMMIAGFGTIGVAMRRRQRVRVSFA